MTQRFAFDAAIEAHREWMRRLDAFVHGGAADQFDLDSASDFNHCALGRWLSSEGPRLAALKSFAELEKTHRLFHTVAGDVICLMRERQGQMASLMLKGLFADLSADIIALIEAVRVESLTHPPAP